MLNFTNGMKVVSSARKFIIQVPKGPVVEFPAGATVSEYGQNNSEPVIVVHNHIDTSEDPKGSWQGADSESGVVIMNNVPEVTADQMLDLLTHDASIDGVKAVISFAESNGCLDNYTTSVVFANDNLSAAGRMIGSYTGIVKRDDKDVCLVVRDADRVIQRKLGDSVNHIDTDEILVRDYVMADGSPIDPASIPAV